MIMKRRDILKTAGCTLFLPSLESFGKNRSTSAETDVKRLFCVSMGYGLFTDVLPQTDGADYIFSNHMEPLKKHRNHFTLYSKMKFGGPRAPGRQAPPPRARQTSKMKCFLAPRVLEGELTRVF